jgi:hypothetical protein
MLTNVNTNKKHLSHLVALVLVFFTTCFGLAHARAEVLFEGYYKILMSGVHSGYAIQKYELDSNKKEFKSSYYIYVRTSPDGSKSATESLVAFSDDAFRPKKYEYTAVIDGKPMTIDATFSKDKLSAKINKSGAASTQTAVLPKGTFLSTMLLYMVLQKGMKVGSGYSFKALAEEDAKIYDGTLKVVKETPYKSQNVFELVYLFKGVEAKALVSASGHTLYTNAELQKVETELVTNPMDARANFNFPEKTIKRIFGDIPKGVTHSIIQKPVMPKSPPAQTTPALNPTTKTPDQQGSGTNGN